MQGRGELDLAREDGSFKKNSGLFERGLLSHMSGSAQEESMCSCSIECDMGSSLSISDGRGPWRVTVTATAGCVSPTVGSQLIGWAPLCTTSSLFAILAASMLWGERGRGTSVEARIIACLLQGESRLDYTRTNSAAALSPSFRKLHMTRGPRNSTLDYCKPAETSAF